MNRLVAFSLIGLTALTHAQDLIGTKPPKLVVLVSIDQFRADYLERFAPYYLPARAGRTLGGFEFLVKTGANFRDAHHNHIPTATGPGHATLMTGSEPAIDGIIGNDWFDRTTGKPTYCVDDPSVKTIGGSSKPMSARNLRVTTVGDELKMATGGRSKVVGVSLKDRAAILMAGHAADTVIWFDGKGNWVSSSFYGQQLPSWVQKENAEQTPQRSLKATWEPLLPASAYQLTRQAPGEKSSPDGKPFTHNLSSFDAFTKSSFGQEYVFHTVRTAIEAEQLGKHDVPDVLVVNLASNDYIGHQWGPNSPEVMDISVRTDRLLSGLFNMLDASVPGGIDNVAIVVTADHGVLPVPEESGETYKTSSGRIKNVVQEVKSSLDKSYGEADWVLGSGLYEQNLFLNRAIIAEKNLNPSDVERTAAEAASNVPGVFAAFTRTQILHGEMPAWDWTKLVTNGYSPTLGGDIMVIEAPGMYPSPFPGTGHGSPWAYDSHVPILIRGPHITPGAYDQRVYTSDIAPTLCHMLGIEYPTGNVGHILPALK